MCSFTPETLKLACEKLKKKEQKIKYKLSQHFSKNENCKQMLFKSQLLGTVFCFSALTTK